MFLTKEIRLHRYTVLISHLVLPGIFALNLTIEIFPIWLEQNTH
jgi:hypothetical protein